jgi:hypothetical protein
MKHMTTTGCLVIAAALAAAQLSAQTEQEAAVEPRLLSFSNEFSASASGTTDMKGAGKALGGISSSEIQDAFSCTVNPSPALELSFGTSYHGSFFDADHENAAPMVDRLQSIENQVSVQWTLSEKWIAIGGVGQGWYNSGSSFNSDGLGFTAFAGALRSFGPNFSVMAGIAYDSLAKDNHKVMPGFGIRYVYSPDWTFSLGFPETAITWTGSEYFSLSLVGEGNLNTYYVRAEDVTGNGNSPRVRDGKMEYEDLRLGLRMDSQLSEIFKVSATVGYLFNREFDFYESKYELDSKGGAPYASFAISAKF